MPNLDDDCPSAFIAMPFDSSLRPLFDLVIRPTLEAVGIRAVRADEMPKGGAFMNNVFLGIEEASLVIGVTSGACANVFYELGYAQQLHKEIILMADDPSSIPADIRHINHFIYSPKDLDKAHDAFSQWVNGTVAAAEALQPSVLRRGEVFENVVDGTFYLQRQRPLPSKDEVLQCLQQRLPLSQRLLYLTEEGQTAYLQLCNDPEYLYYRETTDLISQSKKDVVSLITDHYEFPEVDFISLGPGNGQKDAALLDEFCRQARPHKFIYYYPYDVSGGLLLESLRNVFAKKLPTSKLRVKAIEADIQYLPTFKPVFDFRKTPNVYSLLGGLSNTGNEMALLELLNQVMTPEDWFLCEVRRKGAPDANDAMGQFELNRRLDLAPLNYFGAKFDEEKLEYVEVNSRSTIPNTRTVVGKLPTVTLDRRTFRNVELFYIDYYDEASLSNRIRSAGFQIIQQYEKPHSLYYVLRTTVNSRLRRAL